MTMLGSLLPLVNRMIAHDAAVAASLMRHAGKTIRLDIAEWRQPVWLLISRSGFLLLEHAGDADAAVQWSLVDAQQMLLFPQAAHHLHLSGSLPVLQDLFAALSQAHWDALPLLHDHCGMLAASILQETYACLRDIFDFLSDACKHSLRLTLQQQYCDHATYQNFHTLLHTAQRSLEHTEQRIRLLEHTTS